MAKIFRLSMRLAFPEHVTDNKLVIDIIQKPIDNDSLTAKITHCIGS
jgi:hypothetical protein